MQKLRPLLVFVIVLVIFLVGLWVGFLGPRLLGLLGAPRVMGSATVLRQVQTLAEFVTVKYVMEKVVVFEDVKWYPGGDNRVLLVAHGIVKAGVDFKQLSEDDVQVSGPTVSLRLPPAKITDSYLDEKQTYVVERTTGLLRMFDKDLEQTARQTALVDIQRAARNSGILKDADERARDQLRVLFLQLGFEKVEFR